VALAPVQWSITVRASPRSVGVDDTCEASARPVHHRYMVRPFSSVFSVSHGNDRTDRLEGSPRTTGLKGAGTAIPAARSLPMQAMLPRWWSARVQRRPLRRWSYLISSQRRPGHCGAWSVRHKSEPRLEQRRALHERRAARSGTPGVLGPSGRQPFRGRNSR
jgi:hypothetical protein